MDEQNDLKIHLSNEEPTSEYKIIEKKEIIEKNNLLNKNETSNISYLSHKEDLKEIICEKETKHLESVKKDDLNNKTEQKKSEEYNGILNDNYVERSSNNDLIEKTKDACNNINNIKINEEHNKNINCVNSIDIDQNNNNSNMKNISDFNNKESNSVNEEINHTTSLFLEKSTSNINSSCNLNDTNNLYNIIELNGTNNAPILNTVNKEDNAINKTSINETYNINDVNNANGLNLHENYITEEKKIINNKEDTTKNYDDNRKVIKVEEKINENIDNNHIMNDYSKNLKKQEENVYVENTVGNNSKNGYNDLLYNKKDISDSKEGNMQNKKNNNDEVKHDVVDSSSNNMKNYKNGLENYNELNDFTKKKVQMEIFLHNQINCYDMLLEIRKRIPLWGEYEANFFFHWRKIMTLNNEELKIYILIFRSLSIENVKYLDFHILKIIVGELDELRKVHEPNYQPFKFTEDYMKNKDLTFQNSSDVYVNMNEFVQPWYMKNNNKFMNVNNFLNSLDILENQKQKSCIIQAMEIPSHIFEMCNKTNKEENTEKTDVVEPDINKTPKKMKKDNIKKRESNKLNANTSTNPRPKKRTGYYALEIDGVIASFEARKGVYYDKSRKLWRANWKENGKIQTKGFSVNEYKSVQLARQKAIEWREKKEAELLL